MIIFSYEPRDAVVPLMDVSLTAVLTLDALGATQLLVVVIIMPDPRRCPQLRRRLHDAEAGGIRSLSCDLPNSNTVLLAFE
jgi:hypothetical protein